MSHFSTLGRGIRQVQSEACLLNSSEDFAAFKNRWIKPWQRIVEEYKRWPGFFQESMVHRLNLVKSLAREAFEQAKYQRKLLDDLSI
jgi:hypothetical protein